MKVLVAIGTRPEAIKLAPVIAELSDKVDTIVCSTGQHREMLEQALRVFSIRPDVELDTMRSGQSLNGLASHLFAKLDEVLLEKEPDWVLVQGDTTSAFCAGMAAFHRGIAVGHVEAGLRTRDMKSPFPEEANRSMLARIATHHFAPTKRAYEALVAEGVNKDTISITGNTVVDSINLLKNIWQVAPPPRPDCLQDLPEGANIVLVTSHRRENFGEVLEGICKMLRRLSQDYPLHHFVFPVHLNPNVREPVRQLLSGISNMHLVEPLDYASNLQLIGRSCLVISDSGGIQEEAPSFGAPVVVMRKHTERLEGVECGFATLAGQDDADIEKAARAWLDHPERQKALQGRRNPYGDGLASNRILSRLVDQKSEPFDG